MVKFYNEALKSVHKNVFYIDKTIKPSAEELKESDGKREK